MTYSDLLVHLTDDPRNDEKTAAALQLSQRFGAHLTALYTLPPPQNLYYLGEYVPANIMQQQAGDVQAKARAAKAAFDAAAAGRADVRWEESDRLPVEAIEAFGRVFDLIVLGQPDPDPKNALAMPAGVDVLPHELALRAGRPILTLPYVGSFPTIGERILVAWNGSKEAARAVHDALPFLLKAQHVTVFSIDPERMRGATGADLAKHLARHGVKVNVAHTVASDISAGEALLSAVADDGADLLVMGAYGHSRLREMVFGGVTQTVLRSMTVPVLFSN